MPDEPAAVVQPEGQGDQSQSSAPYADYLNRLPEEVRGDVEPVFKDWDANVTRRFQDASEYRKTWEPYEQIGVNQVSPEEAQWALQLGQLAQQDPKAFQEWYQGYANERGLSAQEQAAQQAENDPGLEFFGDPQGLQGLLEKQLGPLSQKLEQFEQRFQHQEYQAREAEAREFIAGQVAELKSKHLDSLPADVRERFDDIVERFAARYIESDPVNAVTRGWADFEALSNQLQTAALQGKANQPAPAESGGMADLSPEKITSLKEANRIASEQLRRERAV